MAGKTWYKLHTSGLLHRSLSERSSHTSELQISWNHFPAARAAEGYWKCEQDEWKNERGNWWIWCRRCLCVPLPSRGVHSGATKRSLLSRKQGRLPLPLSAIAQDFPGRGGVFRRKNRSNVNGPGRVPKTLAMVRCEVNESSLGWIFLVADLSLYTLAAFYTVTQ